MFKNYLLIALRNIKKHKEFSFINIFGLSIGIACCILILLWVQDELSYDNFHTKGDEIYRVIFELHNEQGINSYAIGPNMLAPTVNELFHEVVNFSRFLSFSGWHVKSGENSFLNDRLATADPSLFEMFTFPFLKGNPRSAFSDRQSVVMTERMAKKYFGDENPIGRIIQVGRGALPLKVTGVIEDVPRNSHMQFDCVIPLENTEYFWRQNLQSWKQFRFFCYLQLQKNSSADDLSKKIAQIAQQNLPDMNIDVRLQPLRKVHLFSNFREDDSNTAKGSILYVYIFPLIALWILGIACINYINLTSALSLSRAKEVGIRKVIGAQKSNIIKQFFGEAITLAIFSLVLAIYLVFLFLPVFNDLSGKQLTLNLGFSSSIQIILGIFCITLLTGILAGSYSALRFSAFQPSQVFKGIAMGKSQRVNIRKILVVFQFTLTIILIIATTVIYGQLHFMRNKDLGFDKDNVICMSILGEFMTGYEAIKNELLENPNILSLSRSWPPIIVAGGTMEVDWEGKNPNQKIMISPVRVDSDYLKTFNMEMVEGRFFSKDFSTDISNYVLNETAVRTMGLQSPVGKWFSFEGKKGFIIGIIKDSHQDSLYREIEPLAFHVYANVSDLCVKISSNNVYETLGFLEMKWEKYLGGTYPFTYQFLDEIIDNFYKVERKIGSILRYFAIMAIFISCLGLFGLASFMTKQRTKEIAIRKVLGASASDITILLSKSFTRVVLLANIIAWPISWYAMDRFLENYAYRISIGWEKFIWAGGIALIIALVAIGSQIIKTARADPVDSLKYE